MTALFATITTALFFGYTFYAGKRFGVLKSVSSSAYELPRQEKWKFSATLMLMGVVHIGNVIVSDIGLYGIIASAGIAYTGISYRFREGAAFWVHYIGVVSAIVALFTGFGIVYDLWLPAILFVLGSSGAFLVWPVKKVWYIELFAMLMAWLGYIMIYAGGQG